MAQIHYCPAPTGAGKTFAVEERLADLTRNGESVILLQPSKILCHQTAREMAIRFNDVPVEVFNQDTCGTKTVVRLANHLRNPPDRPHVIIATWAAFLMVPQLDRCERFHLICDEIPQAFVPESIRLPDNHSLITDALEIVDVGPIYGLIKVANSTVIRRLAENAREDALNDLLNPIARRIHSGRYLTYVERKSYGGLLNRTKDDRSLVTYSMLNPSVFQGFQSVTLAGARAEETILYKWLILQGTKFIRDEDLMRKLRYQDHLNGELVEFHYASERNWSMTEQRNDPLFRPKFVGAVSHLFASNEFVWQDNVSNEAGMFKENVMAHNVGHSAHGMNQFQHINRAAIFSSKNYSKDEQGFLSNFCQMSPSEQRVSLAYHKAYQTYNRISVRDPDNRCRKIVVLPDRQNAAWQQERYPGSTVVPLGIDFRPIERTRADKVFRNAADRQKAHREKLNNQQDVIVSNVIDAVNSKQKYVSVDECHDYSFNSVSCVTSLQGSIIAHKKDNESTTIVGSKAGFIANMKQMSKNAFESKDHNGLISPALFIDQEGVVSRRGKPNAFCGRNIYLDIENGTLTHRQLANIFPSVEMLAYSSYSHTKKMPRYRVVLLTDSIVSPDMYTSIYNMVCERIELAGYKSSFEDGFDARKKIHGIDRKPYLTDLFYLPCQPANGPGFFLHYNRHRKPLNVMDWCSNSFPTRFDGNDLPFHETRSPTQDTALDHAVLCEQALQRFRDRTLVQGQSHKALREMNFTLIEGGVDDVSRDVTLTHAAYLSRSPQDRIKDKTRLMRMKSIG
nr:DEAD/DEAH box helicase family protein [Methylorubrum zatmanii]